MSTGSVNEHFGQASLDESGLSLTLQVRADSSLALKQGMRCVIVEHDSAASTFTVEPLPESEPRPRIDTSKKRVEMLVDDEVAADSSTTEKPADRARGA